MMLLGGGTGDGGVLLLQRVQVRQRPRVMAAAAALSASSNLAVCCGAWTPTQWALVVAPAARATTMLVVLSTAGPAMGPRL